MFGKFFQYEFKTVSKFGVPLLIAEALLGLFIDFSIALVLLPLVKQMPEQMQMIMGITGPIFLILSILAIAAISVVALVLLLKRYYDSTMTAEGYLTFTLPVKQSDIFLAKLLNAWIWSLFFGLIVIIDLVGAVLTITFVGEINIQEWGKFFADLIAELDSSGILSLFSSWQWISIIVCAVLIVIVMTPTSLMIWFSVITFVSVLVKKNRIIIMIVVVYGLSFLSSILMSVWQTICMVSNDYVMMIMLSEWLYLVGCIALLVGGYFLNRHLLTNKLNLE